MSITGGEPLEQPEFVGAIARRLRGAGMRVYLETNGLHATALETLVQDVDVLAMDIKLPSAVGREVWEEHRAFLRVLPGTRFGARANVRDDDVVFAKVVVDESATPDEVATAARIIAEADRRIPLILQPESGALLSTRTSRERARRLLETVFDAQRLALDVLDVVRVVPQCHRILGVR